MKIIYYSYSSTFAALLAACLHVNIYNPEELPDKNFITAHFDWCARYSKYYGYLYFIGTDENNNEIYCMGCKRNQDMVKRILENMQNIFGLDDKLYYIDTGSLDKNIIKILNLAGSNNITRWLFGLWFHNRFRSCIKLVDNVKEKIRNGAVIH